jgi:hypothetical protein
MLQELQNPERTTDEISSELKGVPFPRSQFNPWEAAVLTNQAIQAHLKLLHEATGTSYQPLSDQNVSTAQWVQSIVSQAWHVSQRISPTALNEHLAWRSAEQIFRFGMAYNRSTYFLTPYHSLFFSWENFGKETLPIYAREGAFLCQRFHPEETNYHLVAYYVGAFLYQAIKNTNTTAQNPVTAAYLDKLAQWAKENGAQNLLVKRVQRHTETQTPQLTTLQSNLWMAAYAAYTQDSEPLIQLTLQASRQLDEEQLTQMGEQLLQVVH